MELYSKHVEKAIEELLNPSFETTKQYLEVCKLEYLDGKPKVARVNSNYYENLIAIYFPVQNHRYFIEVHVSDGDTIEVQSVCTESAHRVYFTATSEELSYSDLEKEIKLAPLEGWSKGDTRRPGTSVHTFSRLRYEPIKIEAYSLEEKLNLLLDDIESDKEGVLQLGRVANAGIVVCRHQYISGNMGIEISAEVFKRMSTLNLGLDIDTYLTGEEIMYV